MAGCICRRAGRSLLTSELVLSGLPDGFTIFGGGRLKLKTAAGTQLLSITGMNDVRVVDCRFDGNSATGSNPVISLSHVTECSLRGLLIVGWVELEGIFMGSCTGIRISDCNASAQTPGVTASSSTYTSWMNVGIADEDNY